MYLLCAELLLKESPWKVDARPHASLLNFTTSAVHYSCLTILIIDYAQYTTSDDVIGAIHL